MSTLELLHQLTCKIIYNLLNIKKTFLFLYIFQQKEFETSKSTKKNTIGTFTEFQGHQVNQITQSWCTGDLPDSVSLLTIQSSLVKQTCSWKCWPQTCVYMQRAQVLW